MKNDKTNDKNEHDSVLLAAEIDYQSAFILRKLESDADAVPFISVTGKLSLSCF
jgi:hypothetical protein